MAGARKQTRFLHDDELLAEFEALSDTDTSNSESESESEREVSESEGKEICDNFESDSHEDATQHTKRRRTAGPSFQWQRENFVPHICHDQTALMNNPSLPFIILAIHCCQLLVCCHDICVFTDRY
jgi:hypothetical protein